MLAPWRISGPAAASLAINVLLIVALLQIGAGRTRDRVEQASLTVLPLAITKGVDDGGGETAAATEPPSSTPMHASTPPVVAEVRSPVIVPPSALVRPMPMVASPSLPESAAAAPSLGPATATVAPVRRGAVDGLDVKTPSGTSRSYAAKVRSWLYAHKIYPRRAKMRHMEGQVQVRFVLDRAGMLIEGVVLSGSGHAVLDDEASAMMRRASPYPRAPEDVSGERIEFIAPIEFTLPV